MDEDSRSIIHDLKKEWKLFWKNLLQEGFQQGDQSPEETHPLFPENITCEQLQGITRNLSHQRHEIHQRVEAIQKELEELEALLKEQQAEGKPTKDTLLQIEKLNDLGQRWSEAIQLITHQLKLARRKEAELRKQNYSPGLRRRMTGV